MDIFFVDFEFIHQNDLLFWIQLERHCFRVCNRDNTFEERRCRCVNTGTTDSDSMVMLAWFSLMCILNNNVLHSPMFRELKYLLRWQVGKGTYTRAYEMYFPVFFILQQNQSTVLFSHSIHKEVPELVWNIWIAFPWISEGTISIHITYTCIKDFQNLNNWSLS